MIINSNAKFNTVYTEVGVIGFGSIAAPFCALRPSAPVVCVVL